MKIDGNSLQTISFMLSHSMPAFLHPFCALICSLRYVAKPCYHRYFVQLECVSMQSLTKTVPLLSCVDEWGCPLLCPAVMLLLHVPRRQQRDCLNQSERARQSRNSIVGVFSAFAPVLSSISLCLESATDEMKRIYISLRAHLVCSLSFIIISRRLVAFRRNVIACIICISVDADCCVAMQ